MNLEKNLEMSLLYEFYGKLLTKKQQDIFLEYYFNDMSLAEIAENYSISRQAVLDSLQKSERQLTHFENTLSFMKKYDLIKVGIENLLEEISKNNFNKESLLKTLKDLLNSWEGS